MRMQLRLFAFLLALVCTIGSSSCGKNEEAAPKDEIKAKQIEPVAVTGPAPESMKKRATRQAGDAAKPQEDSEDKAKKKEEKKKLRGQQTEERKAKKEKKQAEREQKAEEAKKDASSEARWRLQEYFIDHDRYLPRGPDGMLRRAARDDAGNRCAREGRHGVRERVCAAQLDVAVACDDYDLAVSHPTRRAE